MKQSANSGAAFTAVSGQKKASEDARQVHLAGLLSQDMCSPLGLVRCGVQGHAATSILGHYPHNTCQESMCTSPTLGFAEGVNVIAIYNEERAKMQALREQTTEESDGEGGQELFPFRVLQLDIIKVVGEAAFESLEDGIRVLFRQGGSGLPVQDHATVAVMLATAILELIQTEKEKGGDKRSGGDAGVKDEGAANVIATAAASLKLVQVGGSFTTAFKSWLTAALYEATWRGGEAAFVVMAVSASEVAYLQHAFLVTAVRYQKQREAEATRDYPPASRLLRYDKSVASRGSGALLPSSP